MLIQGKLTKAAVFAIEMDEYTTNQLMSMLENPVFEDARVAIMPDVHAGKGTLVGLTTTFNRLIAPAVIGSDIGCGILAVNTGLEAVDYPKFDTFVRRNIRIGHSINKNPRFDYFTPEDSLKRLIDEICPEMEDRVLRSVGTLGGGNHFLELDKDSSGSIWLVIHSGSRTLGQQVCDFYLKKAREWFRKNYNSEEIPWRLEFMPVDEGGEEYLKHMAITQQYAVLNRNVMAYVILSEYFGLDPSVLETVSSIHNYFNFEDNVVRKGAISAHKGEKLIIPLNMRDGAIMGIGKGNPEWNNSAPHGAGRMLSRMQAKKAVSIEDFQKSMEGIFTTCVHQGTIDESPMAYKNGEMIINAVGPTVDITNRLLPVWNFKAAS
ncbi:RtcB family protein [Myxococcota bacterium]|nr:RtcB family protein [Myxococcota bacterium]MBU1496953.1 RtcB family protein [Myxococcota bacterium]